MVFKNFVSLKSFTTKRRVIIKVCVDKLSLHVFVNVSCYSLHASLGHFLTLVLYKKCYCHVFH